MNQNNKVEEVLLSVITIEYEEYKMCTQWGRQKFYFNGEVYWNMFGSILPEQLMKPKFYTDDYGNLRYVVFCKSEDDKKARELLRFGVKRAAIKILDSALYNYREAHKYSERRVERKYETTEEILKKRMKLISAKTDIEFKYAGKFLYEVFYNDDLIHPADELHVCIDYANKYIQDNKIVPGVPLY